MSAGLREWLAREGVLGEAMLRAAMERQLVYGGGLDTAILERGGMSEPALWARLAAASGFPAPPPELCDRSLVAVPPLLPPELTGPLRTVPVAAEGTMLALLCAVPVAADAIRAAAREHGFVARLYVVPETRLFAMRQCVYGEPLPSRYAPLLAQAMGAPSSLRGEPSRARAPSSRSAAVAPAASHLPSADAAVAGRPVNEGSGPATDHDEATAAWDDGRGPLEHFLDLSGPLSTNATGPADDAIAELEVEMEIDLRLDSLAGARPAEALPEAVVSGPARLEVVSSAPAGPNGGAPEYLDSEGDFATEALCRRARDPHDKGRLLAVRALRQRISHPATQALVGELRAVATDVGGAAGEAVAAIDALGELRDGATIPALIEHLAAPGPSPAVAEAAHRALVVMCAQDFGRSRRRWRAWARDHGGQPRAEWLIEALGHKQAAIRTAAIEELRHLAGDSFGYVPRGPKDERDRAQHRIAAWWQQLAQPKTAFSGSISPPTGEQGAFLGPGEEAPLPPMPKPR